MAKFEATVPGELSDVLQKMHDELGPNINGEALSEQTAFFCGEQKCCVQIDGKLFFRMSGALTLTVVAVCPNRGLCG